MSHEPVYNPWGTACSKEWKRAAKIIEAGGVAIISGRTLQWVRTAASKKKREQAESFEYRALGTLDWRRFAGTPAHQSLQVRKAAVILAPPFAEAEEREFSFQQVGIGRC